VDLPFLKNEAPEVLIDRDENAVLGRRPVENYIVAWILTPLL